MAFERFDKRDAVAVNKDAQVSVLPNGIVSLTWRAYEEFGRPEAIEFLFDRSRGVVGLVATQKANPNGYAVRLPRDDAKGKVSVRGTALFKYYDVRIPKQIRAEPFFEDGILCFKVVDGSADSVHDESASSGEDAAPQVSTNDSEPKEVSPF